ncbi:hypothetical protein RJ639_029020 [Escallonia herrerae]|uniref:Uncharacterized protein n=1 Tax=Escallonia herrerae TaxID=1293975 RepID=A0AA89BEE3_9ASTE|nr:hypothetical protein RJ639_029020 [Escallonia herrerae]
MLAFKSEEQLQLVQREEIDDEEDLFELIDKRNLSPLVLYSESSVSFTSFRLSRRGFRFDLQVIDYALEIIVVSSLSIVFTAHGINAGDVKKLQDAGIYTCNGLMMHTKKSLTSIKGLSEAKVDKICEAVEKIVVRASIFLFPISIRLRFFAFCLLFSFFSAHCIAKISQNFGYITGSDALLKRKAVVRITTGSQALDELLGGGIETSAITEAFGEFRCGKTQLAHTLCVSTQLPTNMRGGNGKVAYIDTEGTFSRNAFTLPVGYVLNSCTHSRPDRIVPIAERFGMDAGAVLDNIIYARAYTYEHQYNLLLGLAAKMAEEPFRLLIVDSIIALFRVDFTGRGELADRQQKLAQMLSRLIKIAEEFNVAVYMTNQVIADPGGGVFISDPKKPAGGHVLAHAATIRLMFRKGKGEQRVCKVFDAPNLPEAEAISFLFYTALGSRHQGSRNGGLQLINGIWRI